MGIVHKFTNSLEAFKQACEYIPGGVNSPVRAFRSVDNDPVFISSANGSKITDIDGNEYIDYVCSWGPMILGHSHPAVIASIQAACEKGTSFGAPTLGETALAQKISAAFESIEKVRLVSSGTEAVMTAVRIARGYTARDYIVKMVGCYHGHNDSMLVAAGSGLAEHATPSSAGVPKSFAEKTIAIDYNDSDALKAVFERYPGQIAGVIVEPVAANMGVILPKTDYLKNLRRLCDENETVLIFDEVITGFRVSFGGAQQLYGIRSDLTCLGKIIGGGLPLAAIGGKTEIMDVLAPEGPVYQAGTLSGNPVAVAAANTTLDLLQDETVYQKLEESGKILQDSFIEASKKLSIPVTINRVGSILSCFFTEKPVFNFDDVSNTDIAMFKKFFSEMLKNGVYLAPSAYEAMFVSLAHSKKDLEKTAEIVYNAFTKIR